MWKQRGTEEIVMPKKRSSSKAVVKRSPTRQPTAKKSRVKQVAALIPAKSDYTSVLTGLTQLITDSRRRALAMVNRELVCLYWQIGRVIVEQQETAQWGDAVVEKLAADLRTAFPDMHGLTKENLFRTRKFFLASREIDAWLSKNKHRTQKVATASPQIDDQRSRNEKVATVSPQLASGMYASANVGALSRHFQSEEFATIIQAISWSHHKEIVGAVDAPAERYFYMRMSAAERWSVRELRRQIDAALFERYVSVKRDPEKCLPDDAESGDLLPFKDHYVLEFLGLEDEHTEKQLRKAILSNLRDFFLEFGKDLTFVGEEYPLTVGGDTFYIDLLSFHRRLQCLVSVDLKIGKFKPEYAGKSQFYCVALDEQLRLPHENPSIGLVLCKTADHAQVRLALTTAARKIGIATYQTVLPNEHLLEQRLARLPMPQEAEA